MRRPLVVVTTLFVTSLQCLSGDAQDAGHKYPASIHVVSHQTDDSGRLLVRLRLLIDDHVAIYANPVRAPGMDHASARVTVLDVHGKPLRSIVTYPKGTKLESEYLADYYLYRKQADIGIVLPDNPPLPLIIRARIAGYSEHGWFCLGFGSLETILTGHGQTNEP